MCKIDACRFCWEIFQFVSSCYSGDNWQCLFYVVVEVLWIGWPLVSWVSFWCLPLCLAKVLVFATFFSSATLRRMYQSYFWLCVELTWLSIGYYYHLCILAECSLWLNGSLRKPITLRELGTGSLVYEVPWFGKLLKFMWIILGSIITKHYFGYAMSCKYTSHMGNDCIWWGIW